MLPLRSNEHQEIAGFGFSNKTSDRCRHAYLTCYDLINGIASGHQLTSCFIVSVHGCKMYSPL